MNQRWIKGEERFCVRRRLKSTRQQYLVTLRATSKQPLPRVFYNSEEYDNWMNDYVNDQCLVWRMQTQSDVKFQGGYFFITWLFHFLGHTWHDTLAKCQHLDVDRSWQNTWAPNTRRYSIWFKLIFCIGTYRRMTQMSRFSRKVDNDWINANKQDKGVGDKTLSTHLSSFPPPQ